MSDDKQQVLKYKEKNPKTSLTQMNMEIIN